MENYVVTHDIGTTVSKSSIYKIGDRIELVQSSQCEYPLFAIPGKITAEAIELIEQILPFIRGAEGKIKAIVQNYLTVCQNNPEYTSLMKMTAANIYNYYASKDELLIAIHKKTSAMLYNKISNAVVTADTPLQRFWNMTNAFVEFGTSNINIYDVMFNRPIKQYSDYIGTPMEELSRDEFRNSLRALAFAVKVIRDYIETRPDLNPNDAKFLTIQIISALHGIISLYNSRVLYHIVDDQEIVLKNIVNNIMRSITDKHNV
jgi:AcrR family transcriptional regulator